MLSYWEKKYLLHYDYIIIGSGIVGLSAAVSLKEKQPGKSVLVLERAILPTGASTKNAGFACIGSLTEILDDLNRMPPSEVLQLVELRYKGLQKLKSRLGEKNMDYTQQGSYELLTDKDTGALDSLAEVNKTLYSILGADAFSMADNKIEEFGFNKSHTKHLVQNSFEGELNTGKMMRALINLAISKGVEIKTGCEVSRMEDNESGVHVIVRHNHLNEEISFSARKVAVCTNAFTKSIYPELDVKPGRGQVLITKTIADLKFQGIFHFDKGYYYFRRIDDRVMFGGGRNLDFENEATTEFTFNEKIRADLTDKLHHIILPKTDFEIEDWWTGIMAFGKTKFPVLKKHSDNIYIGVRMGGMGVAIGTEIGVQIADMMLDNF